MPDEIKKQTDEFLGKTVTVVVDRPMGSVHPEHTDMIYPVNYGYIRGVIAADGEEQDAYILGVTSPVKEFTGKVTAVIHRINDVEDKLVAAPENRKFNQAEILEAVHFQEQYFDSSIVSLYEKSCGAVVFRKTNSILQYLLLFQHRSRTWSFPKGHAVAFEKEHQTARREIQEEIGLTAHFVAGFRESLSYPISEKSEKEVVLFLAMMEDAVTLREDEIDDFVWADKDTALKLLKHAQYADILGKAEKLLYKTEPLYG